MLSKCANSACFNSFRYFHQGKLFRMAMSAENHPEGGSAAKKSAGHTEFFWLCEECSSEMTVIFKPGGGVTTQGGTPVQASEAVFNGSPATTDETPNGWRGEQETLNPNAPFSVYVICAGGQPQ